MTSVEIIVGHSWKQNVRYLSDLRPFRPLDPSLDLTEIRDIIDIVVDGNNITSSISEESIFGVIGELIEAVFKLANGRSHKAIIEFHCEPWELVLVPDGRRLLMSVYSIDRHHRVMAHNVPIDGAMFVDAVTQAAESMLTDLFRISERFSADAFVRKFSSHLAQLKRTKHVFFPIFERDDLVVADHDRVASTSCAGGLTLSYRFEADRRHLLTYCGEHIFDLHALLFRGEVEAELEGRTIALSGGYPFLTIVDLTSRVRELLHLLESNNGDEFECNEPLGHSQLDVHAHGDRWHLHARHKGNESRWLDMLLGPDECLDSLLTLAELFVKDLLLLNPHLELNQRVVDLDEEVQNLRIWHQDICGNNMYLDQPEDYLKEQGHLRPVPVPGPIKPTFGWGFEDVRAIFPRQSWRFVARHIDFDAIASTADGLLIPTGDALVCIDPIRGRRRWRHPYELPGDRGGRFALAGDFAVVAENSKGVHLLDRCTGDVLAHNRAAERWSPILKAAHFDREEVVVVADTSGRIVGLSADDAEVLWEFCPGVGRTTGIVFHGPLLSTLSAEGGISTLNPITGETLWKVRLGGVAETGPYIHQGRLYTFTHDSHHRTLTIHAFYPFTGRTVWQVRTAGTAAGQPSFVENWMIVPVERNGQIVLEAIDIEAAQPQPNWELEVSSAGLYQPTAVATAMWAGELHGLVKTDRAETTCFRVRDGEIRWRTMPTIETLLLYGNLPIIPTADAVLTVNDRFEMRSLDSGQLLHAFHPVEAPEYFMACSQLCLTIGEQGAHTDDDDTLTGLSLRHYLAVVE